MAEVSYVFGELRTGAIIEDIDLSGVSSATLKLNDWGSFKGTIQLDQSGKSNADLMSAVTPGKCFMVIERNGQPIWGGIVWSSTYQSQAKTLSVSFRTLEAYFERQRIRTDMSWVNYDRRNILIDLVNGLQSVPERNLDIIVPAYFPDANLVSVEVKAIDRAKYFTFISSIADADTGFDWCITWNKSPSGYYIKTLQIGSLNLGNTDPSNLNFDYPGAITNYYETASMVDASTHIATLGAGSGEDLLTAEYVHQDLIDSGRWLAYDLDVSRKDITSQEILNGIAMQEGILRRPPMSVAKVFVKGDQDPQFGSYNLGDACYVNITDPAHPNGVSTSARIVGIAYTPPSDDSVEEAELIFEGDTFNE